MEIADYKKIIQNDSYFDESPEVAVHARVSQDNVPENFYNLKACIFINPSRPDPGQQEKFNLKSLFSLFFVVPQKVL